MSDEPVKFDEVLFSYPGADSEFLLVKTTDSNSRDSYYLKEITSEGNEIISIYGISDRKVAMRLKTWLERIRSN